MFRIRESRPEDVEQLYTIAEHLNTVNLPADKKILGEILELSERSFKGEEPQEKAEYLFVLEDRDSAKIIGASMIHGQRGTKRSPHIYFKEIKQERYSETLDKYMVHQCLLLEYNFNGPTEIGGLILHPDYRRRPESLGKLLSYMRFLYIAMNRQKFRDNILSNLLPPLEEDGTSKMWKHLGKRFTGLTYAEADRLSKSNKEFISTLFPHTVIYTALLPAQVREQIGQVGEDTKGVQAMLSKIGFEYAEEIDPFDGGPHYAAKTDEISLVKNAREMTVEHIDAADSGRPWALLGAENQNWPHFRCVAARVIPDVGGENKVGITAEVRKELGKEVGDSLWMVLP